MAGERKVFNSKRKQGSIPFDLETDDGVISYYVMKMTCAQTSEWLDYYRANSHEVTIEGEQRLVPNGTKNWREKLLSLSVVDSKYQPLSIEHFNEWTPEAADEAFKLANELNFPNPEVEKKDS